MSSSITSEAERKMLDAMFGAQSVPANYYLGLSTTQPAEDGTGVSEPTIGVNGYARVDVPNTLAVSSFLAAVSGDPSTKKNNGPLTFPTASGDWSGGTDFQWVVVWDHATNTGAAGVMAYVEMTVPKPVLDLDIFTVPDQELNFTLD